MSCQGQPVFACNLKNYWVIRRARVPGYHLPPLRGWLVGGTTRGVDGCGGVRLSGHTPWLVSKTPLRGWLLAGRHAVSRGKLPAVRLSARRGNPLGDECWVESTARRLHLESIMRPRGRQRVRFPQTNIKEACPLRFVRTLDDWPEGLGDQTRVTLAAWGRRTIRRLRAPGGRADLPRPR